MAWNTLSSAQVISEGGFSSDEKTKLETAAGTGADLDSVLDSVIDTVRGTIAAAGMTPGSSGTIPDSLRQDVIAAVRWSWLISFPSLAALQTDARRDANERAQDRFDAISEGKRRVENADGESNAPSPSIKDIAGDDPPDREFTKETMDGL